MFQFVDCEPGTKISTTNRKQMRIIMFISLRLEGAQPRYSTTEQEALAIWRCLKEVSWLVQGSAHPVLVYTDHSALIHLLKGDDAHGKIARWQQKLSEFDVEYVHIPGSKNVIADGLSRMPTPYFEQKVKTVLGTTEEKTNGPETEQKGKEGEKHGGNDRKEGVGKHQEEEGIPEGAMTNRVKRETILDGSEWEDMAEVCAVGDDHERGDKGKKEIWRVWEDSEWYGELTRLLLRGDFAGRNMGTYERRRIRLWSRRFMLFDGRRRKGLFYTENDGRLSLCILTEDVILTLEAYHDCHGHFAGRLLIQFLLDKVYWPSRVKDCHYYTRTCEDCQSMGPVKSSAGIKPIVHLQPFDMVGLDFIGQITPASASGNRFIIIMVDYFSRFLFARAVPAATGEAARGLLETAKETFGGPLAVYTDNSQHFLGVEFH